MRLFYYLKIKFVKFCGFFSRKKAKNKLCTYEDIIKQSQKIINSSSDNKPISPKTPQTSNSNDTALKNIDNHNLSSKNKDTNKLDTAKTTVNHENNNTDKSTITNAETKNDCTIVTKNEETTLKSSTNNNIIINNNITSQSNAEINKNNTLDINKNSLSVSEALLEEEYKKLQLNLSELVDIPKTVKVIPVYKKILLLILNILTFRWLFNTKVLILVILSLALFVVYVLWNLPNYKTLEQYKPKTITRVYSSDGYIISELGLQNRSVSNINNIPDLVKDAFISAEDKTFYTNYGFDVKGIMRALINNIIRLVDKNRPLMGASTITQQVVKNLLLSHDRTIMRKVKEAILTIKLEQSMSKDSILELYLNEIYLGMGAYGVTTAALNYFNKTLKDLTLSEAAFLAMLTKSPNGYNPINNYNGAKNRRDWVINRMLEDGKITLDEAKLAINTPIILNKRDDLAIDYSSYVAEEVRKWTFNIIPSNVVYSEGLFIKTTINNEIQKYSYNSLRKGIEEVDKLKGYRGALDNIFTNTENNRYIDSDIEVDDLDNGNPVWLNLLNRYINNNNLNISVNNWKVALVIKVDHKSILAGLYNGEQVILNIEDNTWAYPNKLTYGSKTNITKLNNFHSILKKGDLIFISQEANNNKAPWKLQQIPKVNGAMVVMNPINGHILAMQGGYSYHLSQFNRATQALRQPGSAFKAFVYLAALEKGMTPATLILDAPYTATNNEKIWKPKNNSSKYAGYVTMRNALEVSRNLSSIRIANYVGLDHISDLSKRLGIYNTNIDNFSEVIGSKETTVLKMVKGYSVLANGGKNIEPVLVSVISNRDGKIIFKNNKTECIECNNVQWKNQKVPNIIDHREIIVDPKDAYLITNMLKGVVNNGIGWRAKVPGYDIAGKTGTTNESKDLWFFGFTPQMVVGIYIGEDTPTDLEPAVASTMVVPIFKDFAEKVLPMFFDQIPFRIPEGIEMRWIDRKTGKTVQEDSPNKFLESFRVDNLPKEDNNQFNLNNSGDNNAEYGIY